jgi:hypothetical protein
MRLSAKPLSAVERATLDLRLNDLMKFLNRPGDWGHDTVLGNLTASLLNFRARLNEVSHEDHD